MNKEPHSADGRLIVGDSFPKPKTYPYVAPGLMNATVESFDAKKTAQPWPLTPPEKNSD